MDIEQMNRDLISALSSHASDFSNVVPLDPKKDKIILLDLSVTNSKLAALEMEKLEVQEECIWGEIEENSAAAGVGGYGEKRAWYQRSENYVVADEIRSIHLGVDIWMKEGTPVFSPLDGVVHSLQDNAGLGDYGPTIILEHELNGVKFYTLYGHLSRKSLERSAPGDKFQKGEQFAELGSSDENGNWPAHLHFQIMSTMLDKLGDFPGVAAESQKNYWLTVCQDPNLILNYPALSDS